MESPRATNEYGKHGLSMELSKFSGHGYLETADAIRHPVRYSVRSYVEQPGALYDSYGRIEPDDARLLVQLLIDTKNGQLVLVLEDGSKLPILLMSSSGAIRVQGVLEAAHT